MGTRSRIAVKRDEGYESIYCHWDGYPEGVGATLNAFYTDEDKINELIALGDLSTLGDTTSQEDTISYNRWRDEGTISKNSRTLKELLDTAVSSFCEYVYVWDDGRWEVHNV